MATKNPNDKYAFLFSGPNSLRPVKDLENVAETLIKYYNYPPTHVTVVLGTALAIPPAFSGATLINGANLAQLNTAITTFAASANAVNNTVVLYFTGWGNSVGGVTTLSIDDAAGTVDTAWLTGKLNLMPLSQVNVVMQQAYAGNFQSALIASVLSNWTFSAACGATDSFGTTALGSFFTAAWTWGLKMNPLTGWGEYPGVYADSLEAGAEKTNLLISMEEAYKYGRDMVLFDPDYYTGLEEPVFVAAPGCSQQYLGLPDLVIHDGSPWYESPDIYLTHPHHLWVDDDPVNADLYIPDTPGSTDINNTVNIRTWNNGTHPVRCYSVIFQQFELGYGPVISTQTIDPVTPSDPLIPGVLLPNKSDVCSKPVTFLNPTTHQCVKAEAELLGSSLDTTWTVTAATNEGQRNIDIMSVVPPPAPSPTILPFLDIMGIKDHVITLKNRFKNAREILLVFPQDIEKLTEMMDFKINLLDEKKQNPQLHIMIKPVKHIPLILKEEEVQKIEVRIQLKPGARLMKDIRIPIEIVGKGPWDNIPNIRQAGHPELKDYAALAGVTIVIRKGVATLKGTLKAMDGKTISEGRVSLRTVDNRHGAIVTSDRRGAFTFKDINADVYRLFAEAGDLHSKEQIVALVNKKSETVNVILTGKGK